MLALQGSQELETINARLSAIVAEAQFARSVDQPRAAEISLRDVCNHPVGRADGHCRSFQPGLGAGDRSGMNAYLNALPEPLYVLFGTGYLGYTAARQWGKVAGSDI